jgi:hypothetical protein
MTIPAQQSSSSASAQQASSSASGQMPTIAKDTVTMGTSVTGLAGVFAERDARDVAHKIAQAVSLHVQKQNRDPDPNKKITEIRVIGDLSALSDITSLRILTGQVTNFNEQMTAYLAPRAESKSEGRVREELFAGAVAGGVLNLFGVITQLVAGTYTYSGQSIPVGSIGGLDIHIAQQFDPGDGVAVCVDRFAGPLPADSDILMQIQDLVSRAANKLNPAISQAASDAAAKAQTVTDDTSRLTELAAEKKTAMEKGAPLDPTKPQQEYDEISERLPGESGAAARAQNLLAEGQALVTAINAFVTAAVSAPAAGGPPPVARAAHGEVLTKTGTALLFAQVIAAGDDLTLRQDLIHNEWINLTGLTAEYALMMPGERDEAAAFGVESAYAVRHGSMHKGLTDIVRDTPRHIE